MIPVLVQKLGAELSQAPCRGHDLQPQAPEGSPGKGLARELQSGKALDVVAAGSNP